MIFVKPGVAAVGFAIPDSRIFGRPFDRFVYLSESFASVSFLL